MTRVCQVSTALPPLRSTVSSGALALSTETSCPRAVARAAAAVTFARVETLMAGAGAPVTSRTLPELSETTTASPPTTGRPR